MNIIKQSFEMIYPVKDDDWKAEALNIEKIARLCYKSEDKITDTSYRQMLANLVKREHFAMIEHGTMTVKFITDRGVSHEIVRHRVASYAQESTRYCNYSLDKFNNEITVISPVGIVENSSQWDIWKHSCETAEKAYFALLSQENKPQIARAVLPNSLKTEIVMTANFREWLHFFKLRTLGTAAHPQIRDLTLPLYENCKINLPEIFSMD